MKRHSATMSDFADFEFERNVLSDGFHNVTVVVKPIDGTVRYKMENRRRGTTSHFTSFAEAVQAYNDAPTGA